MRYAFILLVAASARCFAQDSCANYVSVSFDKISGKNFVSNHDGFFVQNKEGEKLSILTMGLHRGDEYDAIAVNFYIEPNIVCVDEGSKINFLFTDGTRCTVLSTNDFNCKGKFEIYLGGALGGGTDYTFFTDKKIEAIRFNSSTKIVDFEFNEKQAVRFSKELKCISKYFTPELLR
jgi:hypothetical protein